MGRYYAGGNGYVLVYLSTWHVVLYRTIERAYIFQFSLKRTVISFVHLQPLHHIQL